MQARNWLTNPLAWVTALAAALLLGTIALAPVTRTQEARVLVSAREMQDSSFEWRTWLIPHANGVVRLKKPPLTYWLSAISFTALGVSAWAGRFPMALCAVATVIVTFGIARRVFTLRAAFLSSLLLLGSYAFVRFGRLAETDIVMTLALTIAIDAMWRGFDADAIAARMHRRVVGWFQLSGVAIGIAALAKGPPALCAILFLVGLMVITRRWPSGLRWLMSGAPLTAIVIGLSWWVYAWTLPQGDSIGRELDVLLEEPTHPGWFTVYLPLLLRSMLPWTPFGVLAIIGAAMRWRDDPRVRVLLIWLAAVFLPLCVIANKQDHYLLPLMPALAIVTGWWLDAVLSLPAPDPARRAVPWILVTMIALCAGAGVLMPLIVRRFVRGEIITIDLVAFALLIVCAIVMWRVLARRGLNDAINVFAIAGAIIMAFMLGVWSPSLRTSSPRTVADQIRALGGASYCFYGENFSLPLVFELRAIVPRATDENALRAIAAGHGKDLIVIAQTKSRVAPPSVPGGFRQIAEIETKDQKFEIYRPNP